MDCFTAVKKLRKIEERERERERECVGLMLQQQVDQISSNYFYFQKVISEGSLISIRVDLPSELQFSLLNQYCCWDFNWLSVFFLEIVSNHPWCSCKMGVKNLSLLSIQRTGDRGWGCIDRKIAISEKASIRLECQDKWFIHHATTPQ